jgi:hypothetical protein
MAAAGRARAGGAVRGAGAVRAAALRREAGRALRLVEEETAGEHHAELRPDDRLPRPDGHVHPALAYILSHGADGLSQVAEDAVLNANYILRSLEDVLDAPFGASGPCMHEAIFQRQRLRGGLSTIDLAKALIDEGFHPMTMYFPLVVHGAMLIEPTETEIKAALDQFIGALRVAERAKAGDESLKAAPIHAPRRRLDETPGGAQAGPGLRASRTQPKRGMTGPAPYESNRAEGEPRRGRVRTWRATAEPIRPNCSPTYCRPRGLVHGAGERAAASILHFARRFSKIAVTSPATPEPVGPALDRGLAGGSRACSTCCRRSDRRARRPVGNRAGRRDPLHQHESTVSPWPATAGLMRGAGEICWPPGAPTLPFTAPTAGPAWRPRRATKRFDENLRARDPDWGLRQLDDVVAEAVERKRPVGSTGSSRCRPTTYSVIFGKA